MLSRLPSKSNFKIGTFCIEAISKIFFPDVDDPEFEELVGRSWFEGDEGELIEATAGFKFIECILSHCSSNPPETNFQIRLRALSANHKTA